MIEALHRICAGRSGEVPPMAGFRSFSAKGGSAFDMTVARNDDVKILWRLL